MVFLFPLFIRLSRYSGIEIKSGSILELIWERTKDMKKGLIMTLLLGINVLVAQNVNSTKESKILLTKAPKVIHEKFSGEHPGIKPIWYKDGESYVVSFSDANTKLNHSIIYDKNGRIISRESELDYKEYPVSINQYYSRRFPEEKYRIIQSEASNGEKYYYSKRKNEIIKFDTTGSYISTK